MTLDLHAIKTKLAEYDPDAPRCAKQIEEVKNVSPDWVQPNDPEWEDYNMTTFRPCCRPEGHDGECRNSRLVLSWPGFAALTALIAEVERLREIADSYLLEMGRQHKKLRDQAHRLREGTDEVERLREHIANFEDDFRRVTSETCAPDERHCSCVPHLRAEVERLRAEATEREERTARIMLEAERHRRIADEAIERLEQDDAKVAEERAAVVKHLRMLVEMNYDNSDACHAVERAAEEIERGEHRREEKP